MTPYAIAVFLHVVGALGLFAAMGLEWVLVARLRRVESAEQARDWLVLLDVIRRLSPASLAVLLLAGIYMAATAWGGVGWIVVGFVALLLLPPLGMIAGLRLPAIRRELENQRGPLPPGLRRRLDEPLFLASIQIRTAISLGIVFLMTTKPDAAGSAVAIAVAVALGVSVSVPALNRARQRDRLSGPAASGRA
ncbi:MAG: hypothetical protein M3336_13820 [Chloroflexota bacterium]|nr:hypothetical protein [Chloroflexota bacterium]